MSNRVTGRNSPILLAALSHEVELISKWPHPNILELCGVSTSGTMIVYELMQQDLAKLLASNAQSRSLLPTHKLLRVLRDVAAGVDHLHSLDVMYRDLKPANVLLRDDQVKLCDFGMSKPVQAVNGSVVGTPGYMAPEVESGEKYGKSADVWSFGALLFECVTGKAPNGIKKKLEEKLKKRNCMPQFVQLFKEKLEDKLKKRDCMPELVKLFSQCHEQSPDSRPPIVDVKQKLEELLMQHLVQADRLAEELKRAQAQDRDTYDRVWSQDYANKSHTKELLQFVRQMVLCQPQQEVKQPLENKGSISELANLADGVCDRLHTVLKDIVSACKGEYNKAPRKDNVRSATKVKQNYGGDYRKLLDLERATGIFEDPSGMLECLRRVRDASSGPPPSPVSLLRCKDRLNSPLDSGYRDILLNVKDVRSGFVMELQINLAKIANIKNASHRVYEFKRAMEESKNPSM